jgi:hypothetical protein
MRVRGQWTQILPDLLPASKELPGEIDPPRPDATLLIGNELPLIDIFILTNNMWCPILWTAAERGSSKPPRCQKELLDAPPWSGFDFHPRESCS